MAVIGSTAGWTADQLEKLAADAARYGPATTIYADAWLKGSYPALANTAAFQAAQAERARMDLAARDAVWTRVEDASAFAEEANRQLAVQQELERRRASYVYVPPLPAGASADPTVATVWNPTPTNYNPTGQTDMERQLAAIAAAEVAPIQERPPLTYEEMGLGPAQAAVLEARRENVTPVRAIDELGGHAEFTNVQPTAATSEEEPMLGGLIGGAAKFLTGGAKALLESRRETGSSVTRYTGDPEAVPGMPSYSQASVVPWGAVGQTVGKIASTLGTAYTGYMAGQAILGGGRNGVIMGAVKPKKVNRDTLVCPPKYVLGVDGQCYPKSMLPRSARKWTPDPKPIVSRSDQKAITRAASAKKRLVKITNAAGAHATLTRPRSSAKPKRK